MRRHTFPILVLLLASILSCAGPPKTKQDLVYHGLSEELPRLDPSLLSGRRVLIDPGHGGFFAGTRGQGGLEESKVNLGVALYLWGLLRESGAEVHLTRSAERDFLTEADSTLAGELGVRVEMVDSLQPDIMVSIHHNAQNDRDPDKNAVETYYRFGDPASRDLAFAVHRHLMRNLGISVGEVRPGNYFILRNIDIPAILGEGSYLTNPGVERSLRLSEKQRLEAEAYYLGILEFFSRGTPRLTLAYPKDSILTDVPTVLFDIDDVGGLGVDRASIELVVRGERVEPYLDEPGTRISYQLPWDAPNGSYTLSLSARNMLGNSSRVHRLDFHLQLPPQSATFETTPANVPRPGETIRVRARLLDRRGLSIADGTPVAIRTTNGESPGHATIHRGFVEFPVTVAPEEGAVQVTLAAAGRTFDWTIEPATGQAPAFRRAAIVNSATREAVTNATIVYGDSLIANGSHSGVYFIPAKFAGDEPVWIQAAGYRPVRYSSDEITDLPRDTLALTPWLEGKLMGRRFLIDPEGGFGPEPGVGDLGLPGPYVNLMVARYLAEYLTAAGAWVHLTRRTEETLSPRDVVAVTNRFGADRYIEIRHRRTSDDTLAVRGYHFPGSRNGQDMAARVQERVAATLGLPVTAPQELVTFPLQQTACPAIVIELPSIGIVDEELRLGAPWYQRKQAYGIFLGILTHYDVNDGHTFEVVIESGAANDNWLITVDRTWSLLSSPDGSATFASLPPGTYEIEVRRGSRRHSLTKELAGSNDAPVIVTPEP